MSLILSFSSAVEAESTHRHRQTQSPALSHRHGQSPAVSHRRMSITSVIQGDSLKVVLPTDEVTLKRHLGLFSGVCFIISIIVGKKHFFFFRFCYHYSFLFNYY